MKNIVAILLISFAILNLTQSDEDVELGGRSIRQQVPIERSINITGLRIIRIQSKSSPIANKTQETQEPSLNRTHRIQNRTNILPFLVDSLMATSTESNILATWS